MPKIFLLCILVLSLGIMVFAVEKSFTVTAISSGAMDNNFRLVVPLSDFPMDVTENSLAGYAISGTMTNKSDSSKTYELESVISANEMRDTQTVSVVPATDKVPVRPSSDSTYNNYSLTFTVSKAEAVIPNAPAGYKNVPTIFIKAQDFAGNNGSWNITPPEAGSALDILKSGAQSVGTAKPAHITIDIPQDGTYTVWARARDYEAFSGQDGSTVESGTRFSTLR